MTPCAPYALSKLTGIPFHDVLDLWKRAFRLDDDWDGLGTDVQCAGLLWKFNMRLVPLQSYARSLPDVYADLQESEGQYLIFFGCHCVVLRSGKIIDRYGSHTIADYPWEGDVTVGAVHKVIEE